MANYSRLTNASAAFSDMLGSFGVVTVMNAKIYDVSKLKDAFTKSNEDKDLFEDNTAEQIYTFVKNQKAMCELKHLKVANINVEGPTKTVTGGQYTNPLIKFGKTARIEMQNALGNAEAIEALGGGLVEYSDETFETRVALHVGSDFADEKLILGESFFIDQKTGQQVPVVIMLYQVLPDSIFNLAQDAAGDATVFDMNGDLLMTDILVGDENGQNILHGEFYSILSK